MDLVLPSRLARKVMTTIAPMIPLERFRFRFLRMTLLARRFPALPRYLVESESLEGLPIQSYSYSRTLTKPLLPTSRHSALGCRRHLEIQYYFLLARGTPDYCSSLHEDAYEYYFRAHQASKLLEAGHGSHVRPKRLDQASP